MSDRFFVQTPIHAERVTLDGPEAHHLIHVMRAKPGEHVMLFDGSGAEFTARIAKIGRADVQLDVLGRTETDIELGFDLTLAVALPKGDRQRWLVEKAVELGTTRIVPLSTHRGVALPTDNALSRLRRAIIEASKQCGRTRLMEVAPPQSFADVADLAPPTALRLVAHPGGEQPVVEMVSRAQDATGPADVHLAVGPEGGFTSEEVDHAVHAGWHVVDLGPRTLRVETAALALVSLVVLAGGRRE